MNKLKEIRKDFMFQLSKNEKNEVVANCDHLNKLKYSPNIRYAFTEHGAIMMASVLNSKVAIEASIFVVRAFVRLREFLSTHQELSLKFKELELRISSHDEQIQTIIAAKNQLLTPPDPPRKKIGFVAGGDDE